MEAEPSKGRIKSTSRRTWLAVAALAVVAGVVALAVHLSSPGEFEMWGAVRLDERSAHTSDDYCVGGSSYLDIREGAQVKVFGDGDALLATGSLRKGRVIGGGVRGDCGFDFAIPGVRGDQDRYAVQVDDETPLELIPEQARSIVLVELR